MVLRYSAAVFLILSTLLCPSGLSAQELDPHEIYEGRCAGCHEPHAGTFARDHLELSDGHVVGEASRRPLARFLDRGHGRLTEAQVEAMVAHLTAILHADGLFAEHCSICHLRARLVAREELVLRDGVLWGRYSGRDIAEFLTWHGRLKEVEVPIVVDMLTGSLATQSEPVISPTDER